LGLRGAHQIENAGLALAALETLSLSHADWNLKTEVLQRGFERTRWPGRLEELLSHPPVVVDGAHNPAGVESLVAAIRTLYPGQPVQLVFGVLADKDATTMRAHLFPLAKSIHLTPLPSPRTAAAKDSEVDARTHTSQVALFDDPQAALAAAHRRAQTEGGLVLVAGSLVLVGIAREWANAQRATT
jgi:dihydrofolate synthase/folylpolyglutamate synthase